MRGQPALEGVARQAVDRDSGPGKVLRLSRPSAGPSPGACRPAPLLQPRPASPAPPLSPQVGNLGLLFMLLFFIYAALGVELFGKLGE